MPDIKKIKGIGPSTLLKLNKLGIFDSSDLLYHFPKKFIDRRKRLLINDLNLIDHENYHCIGKISKIKTVRIRGNRIISNAIFEDESGFIKVNWFNNPYISSNFQDGEQVIFSGVPDKKKLINPVIRKYSESNLKLFENLEPVYHLTKGITSLTLRKFILELLTNLKEEHLAKSIPDEIISGMKLISKFDALINIHNPKTIEDYNIGKRTLSVEELYQILKKVKDRKVYYKGFYANEIRINNTLSTEIIKTLTYKLTDSQEKALEEIYIDLSKKIPMHRLINGDVGSGKSILAILSMIQTVWSGKQCVYLAPTEILARQQFEEISQFKQFLPERTKIHLVTSSTKSKNNFEALLSDKNNNEIFVGTHALLFNKELMTNVGLVVIDEQHKFGVKQREALEELKNKNESKIPHTLSLSATPIPRTIALTLFGDIDISVIQKPLERKPIISRLIEDKVTKEKMYKWIREQIQSKNQQVYIVCPLITEGAKNEDKSVEKIFRELKQTFKGINISMLHGKMKPKDKNLIVDGFKSGVIKVLIATSLIEVGVNHPNANIMVIYGAERFGLAQLHQLRGRVGRSDKKAYCFLICEVNEANERLNYFITHDNGFEVAEFDLQIRGPGEVYGQAQSGLPDLKIASILDIELINEIKVYL